ncbi:MAG: FecR family protein [Bacteroidales bacterium]|nr:FecR domain-containing protein [Bacteroidales bacterium]MDD2426043.1 FecR family protein [Bacteroidales bacterium]MDD3990297.1 FecR family protein [Bacteroidales bacterium]MDD4639558.1 FecR family protein [Bacteroidales bacterium]
MNRYFESPRIAKLLAKLVTESISEEEKRELAAFARKSGIDIFNIVKNASPKELSDLEKESEKKVWESIEKKINMPLVRKRNYLLRYAAIFALLLSISSGIYLLSRKDTFSSQNIESIKLHSNVTVLEYPSGEKVELKGKTDIHKIIPNEIPGDKNRTSRVAAEMLKIKVSSGSTHTITLDDGTTVVLYPESELQFPSYFSSSDRSVKLTGEGFFEVQKDPSRPFNVTAGETTVTVLGTSFNIRAYSGESTVETALVSGKVRMNQTELYPNQLAILNKSDNKISIEEVEASAYRERAYGMFIFENRSIDDIMREFGMWFGFSYTFQDNSMKDKKFRFKLPRSNDFGRLMELMEKTGEIQFQIKDTIINILPGKS